MLIGVAGLATVENPVVCGPAGTDANVFEVRIQRLKEYIGVNGGFLERIRSWPIQYVSVDPYWKIYLMIFIRYEKLAVIYEN